MLLKRRVFGLAVLLSTETINHSTEVFRGGCMNQANLKFVGVITAHSSGNEISTLP